jgi:hypothetical protein
MANEVSVKVGRAGDGNKYVIIVSLYSHKKRGLKATTEVDPGVASTADQLKQLVYAAGAACAEHLCGKYQEEHDPSICGTNAVLDFARECEMMAELKQGTSAKAANLLRQPLQPEERARLDRLLFTLNRGADPTLEDDMWVDGLIARHSRKRRG